MKFMNIRRDKDDKMEKMKGWSDKLTLGYEYSTPLPWVTSRVPNSIALAKTF